ncbi:beta-N-acetylhexosaminidase [Deinococcus peraridilitoris]|nr:beta-N-acetylhexosaminidase [Deinococcus peraridilitoris]
MVDLPGPVLDDDTREHLRRHAIRAVCLFRKNIENFAQLAQLTAELRLVMGPDALIAIDQEGGGVVRTTFFPFPPSAMSLGACGDPALAFEVGAATARGLASLGINWNFAPVLDVNSNPANPVIGDRAFGSDPQQVTPLALAWLSGSLSQGVAGCVKHFPGHGDTHLDSHLALPRVDKTRGQLENCEFMPFQRAVSEADVPAVMTAHIVYPALDETRPATLSERVLSGLLREAWNYGGVIITDSMGMKAIDDHFGRGEAAVMALAAGADMVMALGRRSAQEETLQTVERALAEGRIEQSDTRRSRLRALARRFPSEKRAYDGVQREQDARIMQAAWARGLTTYRDPQFPPPGASVTLVTLAEVPGEYVSEAGLSGAQLLRHLETLYDVRAHLVSGEVPVDWDALREERRPVILATTTRQRFPGWRRARPDLHLALWNPYAVLDVDAPALLSYGSRPEAVQAVLGYLRGEVAAGGRLPVLLETRSAEHPAQKP